VRVMYAARWFHGYALHPSQKMRLWP